jgi:hypothetical protein
MCYYLSKLRAIEILQMKTEFLVDENSNVWFVHASNIQYREMSHKLALTRVEPQKPTLNFEQQKQ